MLEIVYWLIGVFVLLFLISVAFFFKDILRTGKVKASKIKTKEKESFWIILIAVIICIGLFVGEFVKYKPEPTELSYIGIILIFIGGLIRIHAKKELDKFFTFEVMIQEGHKLIKTGLYKHLRHPAYLGNIFMMLGCAFALSSKFGLAAVIVVYIPAMLYRIAAEEKLLMHKFGKEYLSYMQKTNKIIPFIY
jgi:protein-S-isoprenylcysteine O-methyltransferase